MAKKLIEVVVSESKWKHGGIEGDGALLCTRADHGPAAAGKMCCLGFAARQAGLGEKAIRNKGDFDSFYIGSALDKLVQAYPGLFDEGDFPCANGIHSDLTQINDDVNLSLKDRKKLLNAEAKKAGIKFKFVP